MKPVVKLAVATIAVTVAFSLKKWIRRGRIDEEAGDVVEEVSVGVESGDAAEEDSAITEPVVEGDAINHELVEEDVIAAGRYISHEGQGGENVEADSSSTSALLAGSEEEGGAENVEHIEVELDAEVSGAEDEDAGLVAEEEAVEAVEDEISAIVPEQGGDNWADVQMFGIDGESRLDVPSSAYFFSGSNPTVFYLGREVGRGSFSQVFACMDVVGRLFAVKMIDADTEEKLNYAEEEMRLQGISSCDEVVQVFGIWMNEYDIHLLFEFARYGTVESRVFNRWDGEGVPMGEVEAAGIIRSLTRALGVCHERYVVHCDVKLENLMYTGESTIKLGDFGLAVEVEDDWMTEYRSFEPRYAAPELSGDGRYGSSVDMWSVGIVMYELLMGTRRYHEGICSIYRSGVPRMYGVSEAAQDLFGRLVSLDAADRPTAREVLEHGWLVGNDTTGTGGNEPGSSSGHVAPI